VSQSDRTTSLNAFLSWHSLADEVVCAGVATGLRHAPNREARESLLRQIREEYAHSTFMARRVEELGGAVPESLQAMEGPRRDILDLANESWISYLVGFAASIDGIYGYPWSRAVWTATVTDEKYLKFYDTVLFPQEIGHYNFAKAELDRLLKEGDDGARDQVRDVAVRAYPVYIDFISTSFPYLEAVGADTTAILPKTEQIKNTYWPKEFQIALDESLATPDSDIEYGPGM
jgi:hypothetical protein